MQKFSFAIALGAFGIISSIVIVSPALSGSRYSTPSAATLSSELASPWLLQLENKPGQNRMLRLKVAPIVRQVRPPVQAPIVTPIRKNPLAVAIAPRPQQVKKLQPARVTKKKSSEFEDRLLPQIVSYDTSQPAGTVIIATNQRYLYHVLGNGKARRYGIGVGREGFTWSGTQKISRKAEWPGWTPPKEMIAREKKRGKILPAHMPGGPNNPLGARAMYLGNSLYRIHGTTQPWSIGKAVSSGCIRMRNEDVIDLYTRVNVGTKVVVL